ncbi:Protein containing DUF1573 OS=Rhodopirellula baltica SWK14 GN=RBSWK_05287 PE=4 SV=1: DUF1573 [Gemmataceae bacterium]|nr:Protein containing DUF1573 OS=Rhodopirellula baltica SWK14 GN=RBSWK_05287 PE=4 SV=1: DUF1573 [Gemmataceae bacterium]VTT99380.1 Protein containing DUF1573 OS=Rhodopirellula baltica SWK14 GN=RBSWK_05287 PE=4 SV=1: DUF1573 [Gemmataceae bacterium]
MNTLILVLAAGVANPPSPVAGPLRCATPSAAKGDVKGGPQLEHTFELAHTGTGALTITKVEASCGCLRRVLSATALQPGEKAQLTIDVNTLTQPDGPNRWQVSVGYRTEAPGAPPQAGELLLEITATLSRDVVVSPPQVAFSTTGVASQTVTVTDGRPKPLTVLKAGASSAHLTVEVAQRAAGKPQEVVVRLAADAPAGHTDEVVTLVTDDPAYPELRVPVRVLKRAAGGVTAAPASVGVRFAAGQNEVSTLVQLRAADGKPVAVAGAESDHPGVAVKFSPAPGPVAVVRVTVTEAAAAQAGTATVRVRLAEPAGAEVAIPVGWSAAKK